MKRYTCKEGVMVEDQAGEYTDYVEPSNVIKLEHAIEFEGQVIMFGHSTLDGRPMVHIMVEEIPAGIQMGPVFVRLVRR